MGFNERTKLGPILGGFDHSKISGVTTSTSLPIGSSLKPRVPFRLGSQSRQRSLHFDPHVTKASSGYTLRGDRHRKRQLPKSRSSPTDINEMHLSPRRGSIERDGEILSAQHVRKAKPACSQTKLSSLSGQDIIELHQYRYYLYDITGKISIGVTIDRLTPACMDAELLNLLIRFPTGNDQSRSFKIQSLGKTKISVKALAQEKDRFARMWDLDDCSVSANDVDSVLQATSDDTSFWNWTNARVFKLAVRRIEEVLLALEARRKLAELGINLSINDAILCFASTSTSDEPTRARRAPP